MKIIKTEKVRKVDPIKEEYCKLMGIDKNTKLTEDMLGMNTVRRMCIKHRLTESDMRSILTESTVNDMDSIDAETTNTEIDQILNDTLETALEEQDDKWDAIYPAVLLEGDAGVGKTERVYQWVKKHPGFHLAEIQLQGMPAEVLKGIVVPRRDRTGVSRSYGDDLFKNLSKPNTVLFLDEYNKADPEVRTIILQLIVKHCFKVDEEDAEYYSKLSNGEVFNGNYIYFPNLLFVVAAQNPYSRAYLNTTPLGTEEVDRFTIHQITANKANVLNYATSYFNRKIKQSEAKGNENSVKRYKNRLNLATKILSDDDFSFNTGKEIQEIRGDISNNSAPILTPRSFMSALALSNGTKDDFIDKFKIKCGEGKLEMLKNILSDYKDADDKANAGLNYGPKAKKDVFGKADENPTDDWGSVNKVIDQLKNKNKS